MHEIQHITHKESNKPFAPQTTKNSRSKSATLPETTVSNIALENMAFAPKKKPDCLRTIHFQVRTDRTVSFREDNLSATSI